MNWKSSWNFSKGEVNVITTAFNLFLITEILVFLLLFWAWFHASITPAIWVGNVWPTTGIIAPKWWGIGLYNTIILFISSCFITWCELSLKLRNDRVEALTALCWGILASCHFLVCQYLEFSRLPFFYKDSIYGVLFYSITGLHLVHVLIGTVLLIITLIRLVVLYNTNLIRAI